MKTWEVVKELIMNPSKRFVVNNNENEYLSIDVCGELKWFDKVTMEPVSNLDILNTEDWEWKEEQTHYTFEEAKARLEKYGGKYREYYKMFKQDTYLTIDNGEIVLNFKDTIKDKQLVINSIYLTYTEEG